jgi:signal transduction histidine kinase
MQMFHNAAVKLTLWYLLIIMVLSIGCSLALYHVSQNELARNNRRQSNFFNGFLGPTDFNDYNHLRRTQLSEDLDHLRNNLILFNVAVLIGGGAVSYALARRTLRPIEESLESQSRFTADASHELRTPLAAMQTEIEVALRDKTITKDQTIQLLKSNLEEVEKLKALSDGLLKLASENGDTFIREPLSALDIIEEASQRNAKAASSKKITIKQNIKDVQFDGDRQSMIELVNIFIDNAIKYSHPGSEVRLTASRKDKDLLISIADHGQGIKASDLPHIFDRFYRSDPSRNKNQAEGYGLGLAIAKKIVDLHEGKIEVRSAPDKGTNFTIYLPTNPKSS